MPREAEVSMAQGQTAARFAVLWASRSRPSTAGAGSPLGALPSAPNLCLGLSVSLDLIFGGGRICGASGESFLKFY